jgi:hypothetical protein
VIPGLKIRKIGAAGKAFSAGDPKRGTKINVVAEEHGYHVKVSVDLNYNMMTERQGQKAHDLIYAALTEALTYAQNQRKINVPLFSLEELEEAQDPKLPGTEGINSL